MSCKNPAREYLVTYSDSNPAVVINPDSAADALPVLASLFDDRQYILVIRGAGSMTALVHSKPYQKIDWFSDGALVQTDACHG
jgi:hypothetical protein